MTSVNPAPDAAIFSRRPVVEHEEKRKGIRHNVMTRVLTLRLFITVTIAKKGLYMKAMRMIIIDNL
jgi:hypothetical protein